MWTDDDVLTTRWQRWHRKVMALNLDALLRWTLVITGGSMALFTVLATLGMVWSVFASIWTLVAGWLP